MPSSIDPADLVWETRPHEPDEPARHVAELSETLGTDQGQLGHLGTRCNFWRYEPGARGKRHVHAEQAETFVVMAGTLSMYVGEPPERRDVATGGVLHVEAGTPLQTVNHGDVDLLVFVTGSPPDEGAEVLDDAV